MEVFKIQQAGISTQNPPDTSKDSLKETTPEAEAKSSAEKLAVPQIVDGVFPAKEEDNKISETGEKKPELLVKVDGPVSRIFTDALNKMLVTESYMMNLQRPVHDTNSGDDTEKDVDLLVYCWDAKDIDMSQVVKLSNEVTRKTQVDFVIAIEGCQKVTPSIGLLNSLETYQNVKVCFTQNKALALVRERIQK